MDPLLKDRIGRKLDLLSDERGWQVLDYLEFLESKYAERAAPDNVFTRISDTVQDTMRAGKIPVKAISGTVGFLDGASRIVKGVADVVVDQASRTGRDLGDIAKAAAASPEASEVSPPAVAENQGGEPRGPT